MNTEWCLQVYEDAIKQSGCLEIINTDQGSQLTSPIFINASVDREIKISMDGKEEHWTIFLSSVLEA